MTDGYAMTIRFKDFMGERSFGIKKTDSDSISLPEFGSFCYDAGLAYGFSPNQLNTILNIENLDR